MLLNKLAFAIALLIGVYIVGCSTTGPATTDTSVILTPEPGQFGMSWLKGLGKVGVQTDTGATRSGAQAHFDLGQIKGSSSFYFLLYNVGRRPITNVTLSTNDANFAVSPERIDTLIPEGNVGMLPIVKISAYHGTPLDGVGNRPCLPMGRNSATVTISGVSKTSHGDDTTVIMIARIDLTALVMSFDLRIGCTPVDLEHPKRWSGGIRLLNTAMGSAAAAYGYGYDGNTNIIGKWAMLTNKGNVPIFFSVYMDFGIRTFGPISDSVAPGDSIFIARKDNDMSFCLDGNHTVENIDVLQPQFDGSTYFCVSGISSTQSTNLCNPSQTSKILGGTTP